jgi:hypothetical protein
MVRILGFFPLQRLKSLYAEAFQNRQGLVERRALRGSVGRGGSTASEIASCSLLLFLLVFLAGRTCLTSFWSTYWPRFHTALTALQAALPRGKRAEKEKLN